MRVDPRLTVPLIALVVVLGTAGRFAAAQSAPSPLEGVWQVMNAADGPQSGGLYFFTRTHYSMIAAATNRPDIANVNAATADELRAMFGPMLANAGTYEIAGDLMTIHPVAAKFPVVMKPGATEVYAFRVDGSTLYLTQRRNARGVDVQGANPVRLTRVE